MDTPGAVASIASCFDAENLNISRLDRLVQPPHMWRKTSKHLDDLDSCIEPVFLVCGIREVSATHYSQPGTHLGVCHKFRQFEVPSRSEFHNKHVARWKKLLR